MNASIVKLMIVLTKKINNFIASVITNMLIANTTLLKNYKNTLCFENIQNLSSFTEINSHIE